MQLARVEFGGKRKEKCASAWGDAEGSNRQVQLKSAGAVTQVSSSGGNLALRVYNLPLFTMRFLNRAFCRQRARGPRRLTVLFRGAFTLFRFVADRIRTATRSNPWFEPLSGHRGRSGLTHG